jgi:hypothetical protein
MDPLERDVDLLMMHTLKWGTEREAHGQASEATRQAMLAQCARVRTGLARCRPAPAPVPVVVAEEIWSAPTVEDDSEYIAPPCEYKTQEGAVCGAPADLQDALRPRVRFCPAHRCAQCAHSTCKIRAQGKTSCYACSKRE